MNHFYRQTFKQPSSPMYYCAVAHVEYVLISYLDDIFLWYFCVFCSFRLFSAAVYSWNSCGWQHVEQITLNGLLALRGKVPHMMPAELCSFRAHSFLHSLLKLFYIRWLWLWKTWLHMEMYLIITPYWSHTYYTKTERLHTCVVHI